MANDPLLANDRFFEKGFDSTGLEAECSTFKSAVCKQPSSQKLDVLKAGVVGWGARCFALTLRTMCLRQV